MPVMRPRKQERKTLAYQKLENDMSVPWFPSIYSMVPGANLCNESRFDHPNLEASGVVFRFPSSSAHCKRLVRTSPSHGVCPTIGARIISAGRLMWASTSQCATLEYRAVWALGNFGPGVCKDSETVSYDITAEMTM